MHGWKDRAGFEPALFDWRICSPPPSATRAPIHEMSFQRDLNPRPESCKDPALPTELWNVWSVGQGSNLPCASTAPLGYSQVSHHWNIPRRTWGERTRTSNFWHQRPALCQLSYSPGMDPLGVAPSSTRFDLVY